MNNWKSPHEESKSRDRAKYWFIWIIAVIAGIITAVAAEFLGAGDYTVLIGVIVFFVVGSIGGKALDY